LIAGLTAAALALFGSVPSLVRQPPPDGPTRERDAGTGWAWLLLRRREPESWLLPAVGGHQRPSGCSPT